MWYVRASGPVKVELELDVLRPAVERHSLHISRASGNVSSPSAERIRSVSNSGPSSCIPVIADALSALQRGDKMAH